MASFECPTCKQTTLTIVDGVELGPGDDDDERRLQRVRCPCGMRGAAEYRESRRGSGESWHHDGCLLDADGLAALDAWFTTASSLTREQKGQLDGVRDIAKPLSWFRMTLADK